jgi:hypothetical protein
MRHKLPICSLAAFALSALPAAALADATTLAHHVCPDGLEVVVSEMHTSPLVTVEIAAHEGAMTEDDKYNGVSKKYLGHLQAAVVGDPSKVDGTLFTSL